MTQNEIAQDAYDNYFSLEYELISREIHHDEIRIALRMAELAYYSAEYQVYNNL